MVKVKSKIDINVDPEQYAYKKNCYSFNAVSSVFHSTFTHLESWDFYVMLLFLDFSSAFNTIIPHTLANKHQLLRLTSSLCNWVLDFLTHQPQRVKFYGTASSPIILNTGSAEGSVLSPLLYTYNCSAKKHKL